MNNEITKLRNENEYLNDKIDTLRRNYNLLLGKYNALTRNEDSLEQKELTEASVKHRVGKAAKLADRLKNMWIVDFYAEWKTLTTKQKEWLSSEYGITRREPKNLKELEALYLNNLISRSTYFHKKKELN